MGVYLDPGFKKFEMTVKSQIYVDKTNLIEETNRVLGTEQRYLCVSRPRRFGKSVTAHMLAAYYCKGVESSAVFDAYQIAKSKSYKLYQNHYHVIALNMQDFFTYNKSVEKIICLLEAAVLDELKETFPNVIKQNMHMLSMALDKIYAKTGEQFIFIIDEWDCLLRERKHKEEDQKRYLDFIRNLLKDKSYVALAYMTGILPVKKYGTHSALNMFDEYSMTDPHQFAEYVGFTESEVEKLCQQYQMDFNEMMIWYDGYTFANIYKQGISIKVPHIYSPKSVVSALLNGRFGSYWTRTETYEALKVYIEMNFNGLKDAVIHMMSGGKCTIDTGFFQNDMTHFQTKDDVLTLLVHLGYLAFNTEKSEVYIPNMEIREEYRLAIEGAKWDNVVNMIKASQMLLEATWNMDCTKVAHMIDMIHTENTSILSYNDENSLSCVISLAYYSSTNYYTQIRELPTGLGFADIVFLPKKNSDKPAMIVELKYNQSAKGAISQIKEKNYVTSLKEYEGNLLLVGINYDKKSKKHQCIIETLSALTS